MLQVAHAQVDRQDKKKLEKVAIALHCNFRPPDVAAVVPSFNHVARNASAYRLNTSATSAES